MSDTPVPAPPIAVVGMSAIYPGHPGLDGFWRTITAGRDAISDVPPSHWLIDDYYDPDPSVPDRTYCRRGGFIDPVAFDPMQFGLPPNALPATDSAQLLALIAAKQALDCAQRGAHTVDRDRISVVLGVASTTELVVQMGSRLQHPIWRKALLENGIGAEDAEAICADIGAHYAPWQESTFPGLLGNVVAGRVANRLDLGGTNYVTDAACASSLSALQVALHELYLNEADMVLTGGVDALNDIMMFMCFSKTPAFSPTGDCRPFSDGADGTIIGEGVGMLALKRLADAERDGDAIHAVIRGLGSSSDGRASSVYAPRWEGQAKALRRAYDRAGYAPDTVGLVEAHGTATKAGDVAEFASLASVFTDASARCALGSVKSQIGHTKAAAGAAGLIKTVLALQHATLPGTLKVERPNDAITRAPSPFYVNARTRPWVHDANHPRRASVSSFGFGGSNFHVTLEAYEGSQAAARLRVLPSELVLLSAPSPADLAARCTVALQACARGETLARIAATSAESFDASAPARAGIVAVDRTALVAKLEILKAALSRGDTDALIDQDVAVGLGQPRSGKTAFVFPGQGSQYVGMGADLALAFPEALAVWDAVARSPETASTPGIVFPEPAFDEASRQEQTAALTAMSNAQPAIAAASLAQLALLETLQVRADAFAGHSFGEVTALAAAGVVTREHLPAIAGTRGQLMTDAAGVRDGAMLAVAASAGEVSSFLDGHQRLSDALVIANDNAPGQVVLAGASADISAAEALLKEQRITTVRLPVASAFHSPIVASSCAPFESYLKTQTFAEAAGTVYANATAAPYGRDTAVQLADQLQRPVRFREMILAMAADGVTRFVEVGPGRILTGLVNQILVDQPHLAVALDDRNAGDLRGWHRGLAALAADGVALDLAALFASYETPAAHTPAPAHSVMVGGANLGKPYPPADGKVTITPKRQIVRTATPDTAPPHTPTPVPVAVPGPLPAAAAPDIAGDAWSLIDRIQSETVEQHRHYLDVMAQSHQAFLDTSAQMLAHIHGASVGQAVPMVVRAATAPTASVAPVAIAAPLAPSPQSAPVVLAPSAPPQVIMPRGVPVSVAPASRAAAPDDLVLAIVAEKTGYPVDMLGLDMEMEAELGIDSIKQVEILSALQAQFPGAPDIPASELSSLKTLRDVARRIESIAPPQPTFSAAPAATPATAPAAATTLSPDALNQSVLEIVAEKTGYPVDMLGLDMALEAELGIDSIKQVEILSALQSRWPDAANVAPSDLSALKTLRDVAQALTQHGTPASDLAAPVPERASEPGPLGTLTVTHPVRRETPASGFALAGLREGGDIHVAGGDPAFAAAVVDELITRGLRATAAEPTDGVAAVVSLSALRATFTPEDARVVHLEAFRHARAVARSDAPTRVFVTVQLAPSPSGIPTGVAGIVRTAVREWPNASVKAIEMEVLDAAQLVDELLSGGPEVDVVLGADGSRFTVTDVPLDERDAVALTPARGGVLLVSGGGRGVTAACGIELAARHGLQLAFVGRTELSSAAEPASDKRTTPEIVADLVERAKISGTALSLADARGAAARISARREVAATLDQARARGVEAHYYSADVRDGTRLQAIANDVRANVGPIVGVVHGAGVLADKRIADLDEAQFRHVFDAKVAGAEAMLAATRDDHLQVIALFSSIAARAGNAGQAAYAAANEVLNGIAVREASRRGDRCAVRSFGWGPWDGGMVDDGLKRHFERAGIGVIDIDEGAAFFASDAVRLGAPVLVVAAPATVQHRSMRVEWPVSAALLPPLLDHTVQGRIVLPMAVVLERILRAARAVAPTRDASVTVRDLQVLSGVTFPTGEDVPVYLTLSFEPGQQGLSVTIRDDAGRPRYRATIEWADGPSPVAGTAAEAAAGTRTPGAPWRVALEDAYDEPLFHGPQFAALAALEDGGSARLMSLDDLGWPPEPWATDPAAIDGGLQLGLLWAHGDRRPLMLPQRITAFVQHGTHEPGALGRCRLVARPVSDKRVDFDLVFETLDGATVAALTGVEFYSVSAAATATA